MERIKHIDPEMQQATKPGRPPRNGDGVSIVDRQPLVTTGRQSLWTDGSVIPARKKFLAYNESARPRTTWWKRNGLDVLRPPLRSSAWAVWRECPRKFFFSERLGLRSKGSYSSALTVGTILHSLMEEAIKVGQSKIVADTAARLTREAQDKIMQDVDEATGLLPNGRTAIDVRAQIEKDGSMALALAAALLRAYPVEKLLEKYEVLTVERPYIVKVEGMARQLVVKPDLLLRHRTTAFVWILDYKTTSLSPQVRAATMPFEFQPRYYAWVLHLALNPGLTEEKCGYRIGGFIHNIIRKPTIRQKQSESYDQYTQRVTEWYAEQSTLNPNDPPIISSSVPMKYPYLSEDVLVQIYELNRASSIYPDMARFYRCESACFGKFGNSPCPFLKLCRSEHNLSYDWPAMLATDYRQEPRPLEQLESEEAE